MVIGVSASTLSSKSSIARWIRAYRQDTGRRLTARDAAISWVMGTTNRFIVVAGCLFVFGVAIHIFLVDGDPTHLLFRDFNSATAGCFCILALAAGAGWFWVWRPHFSRDITSGSLILFASSAFVLVVEIGVLAVVDGLTRMNGVYG